MLDSLFNKYKSNTEAYRNQKKQNNLLLLKEEERSQSKHKMNLNSNNNIDMKSLFNDFDNNMMFSNEAKNSKHISNFNANKNKDSKDAIIDNITNNTKISNKNRQNKNDKNQDINQLEEEKFEEEFKDIIKKNEDIMNKYCTLYDTNKSSKHLLKLGFNPEYNVEPLNSEFLKKKQNKIDHTKTTGKDWFNMEAQEMTPEIENDLRALQLRHIINPNRFYKKNDMDGLPKFFQLGRLETSITMGKKYRLKKSEVKNSLAEEFLEDDLAANYSNRKFYELQEKKSRLGRKKSKMNEYKLKNKSRGKKNSSYIAK